MDPHLDRLLAGPAVAAAPRLVGWRIACGGVHGVIAEVEAYQGVADRACHASKGRTARTDTLFGGHGTLYIYLCYGMHWLLNLVCDREDEPAAVLIRGILVEGIDPRKTNGPGKVTSVLGLGRAQHGLHLGDANCRLRLEPPTGKPPKLRRGPRVGVDYAGPVWTAKPWRWWMEGFPAVKG